MTSLNLPLFGTLNLNPLQDSYNTETIINGQLVKLDINFWQYDGEKCTAEMPDTIKLALLLKWLNNIEAFDQQSRIFFDKHYQDKTDEIPEFIAFHLEECKEHLLEIIDFESEISPEKQCIQNLKLYRIGFYPHDIDSEKPTVILDYAIGKELFSDQLLVMNFDKNCNFKYLSWES